MNAYQRWIAAGVAHLEGALETEGLAASEREHVLRLFSRLNLPAFLSVAVAPTGKATTGSGLISEASKEVASVDALARAGLSPTQVERVLDALLLRVGSVSTGEVPPPLRREIAERAVEWLGNEAGFDASPAEIVEAAELLLSGAFFEDVGAATAAILFTVRGLPIALLRDLLSAPRLVAELPLAVLRDLGGAVGQVPAVIEDLRDGRLDHAPAVMRHTLRSLYGSASLNDSLEMVRTLIAGENRSVRLALVIYARANGIPLQESDLDLVSQTVLDPRGADLGPALVAAWERLREQHGADRVTAVLSRFGREAS